MSVKSTKREMDEEAQKVSRFCLKCDRRFTAKGRFNRLCPSCTHGNKSVIDFRDDLVRSGLP